MLSGNVVYSEKGAQDAEEALKAPVNVNLVGAI